MFEYVYVYGTYFFLLSIRIRTLNTKYKVFLYKTDITYRPTVYTHHQLFDLCDRRCFTLFFFPCEYYVTRNRREKLYLTFSYELIFIKTRYNILLSNVIFQPTRIIVINSVKRSKTNNVKQFYRKLT